MGPPLTSGPPVLPILRPPLPVQQQTNNYLKQGPSENSNSHYSTPYLPTGPNNNIAAPPPYPNQQLINQFNNTMNLSGPQASGIQPLPQQFKSSNFGQQPPPVMQPQYQQNNQEKISNQSRSQPQAVDLQREKRLFMPFAEDIPPRPIFPHDFYNNVNCHYE